jgi:hypothetical protein
MTTVVSSPAYASTCVRTTPFPCRAECAADADRTVPGHGEPRMTMPGGVRFGRATSPRDLAPQGAAVASAWDAAPGGQHGPGCIRGPEILLPQCPRRMSRRASGKSSAGCDLRGKACCLKER